MPRFSPSPPAWKGLLILKDPVLFYVIYRSTVVRSEPTRSPPEEYHISSFGAFSGPDKVLDARNYPKTDTWSFGLVVVVVVQLWFYLLSFFLSFDIDVDDYD